MADFTTVISGTTELDDSQVTKYSQGIALAYQEAAIADTLVTQIQSGPASAFVFRKYSKIAVPAAALTENEEVVSTVMADSKVTLTPAEEGAVITRTKLINLQSGGIIDEIAARLVGVNMQETEDTRLLTVAAASTNYLTENDVAKTALTASNVLTRNLLDWGYVKLRAASIPKMAGDKYVCVMHPHVASDYRQQSDGFLDISKYQNAMKLYNNEIGTDVGFRIIENALVPITVDGGSGTVDIYPTILIGLNGLGLGESEASHPTIAYTDKLNRFLHLGWTGVWQFGIIDTNAVWVIWTASSRGTN
jgi:N4-gp56 family major capsid protein